jgi:AcrR family transcriptional regulator
MDTLRANPKPVASSPSRRGDVTRERLLDAAEALLADHGFGPASHRSIAGQAGVHVALVNYHFGSKEMLFEEALERRSQRLVGLWRAGLAPLVQKRAATVEDVLWAYWAPFDTVDRHDDVAWRNYICVVARIAESADGERWTARHFGDVIAEFREALRQSLPGISASDLDSGFRYVRRLLDTVLLHRCAKAGGTCVPQGFRADDVDRMIAFLAAGLRRLSLNHVPHRFPAKVA